MAFPVLSRDVINQTLPGRDIPAGDGKSHNLFYVLLPYIIYVMIDLLH
jgi:hypothetical protein